MFLNPSFFVYDINGLELCQGKIIYIFLTGFGNMGNVSVLVKSTFSSGGGVLKNSVCLTLIYSHSYCIINTTMLLSEALL